MIWVRNHLHGLTVALANENVHVITAVGGGYYEAVVNGKLYGKGDDRWNVYVFLRHVLVKSIAPKEPAMGLVKIAGWYFVQGITLALKENQVVFFEDLKDYKSLIASGHVVPYEYAP